MIVPPEHLAALRELLITLPERACNGCALCRRRKAIEWVLSQQEEAT